MVNNAVLADASTLARNSLLRLLEFLRIQKIICVRTAAAAKGFEALDTSAVEAMVDAAIAQQADAWAKYCAGEEKAMGALVGAIMKASQGKADGKVVTAILQARRAK